MARNEDHTSTISEYNIPRQAYRSADHDRRIKSIHHKVTDRRRINAAVINLDSVDSLNLFQIADAAPHDCSAGLCLVADRSGQISADKGSLIYFIVHIRNNNVSLYQRIDHPLVACSSSSLFCSDLFYCLFQIRSGRNECRRHCTSYQFSVIMKLIQMFFKLIFVSRIKKRHPYFFQCHFPKLFQILIRHSRTSIQKTFSCPF